MKKRIKLGLLIFLGIFLAAALLLVGRETVKGYRIYRAALEECSVLEMAEQVKSETDYTTLAQVPEIYKEAVLAAEDHRFYSHGGVDLISIGRAIWNNLRTFSLREGGSTITQQVAKNLYFTQARRLDRKIAEAFMALEIERELEKDAILELYINCIYYGSGHYCIKDAANGYFDKDPIDLSDYEATLLAGLPNAPSVYDPTVNPRLAHERQDQVLEKMQRYGYLSEEQVKEIKDEQAD